MNSRLYKKYTANLSFDAASRAMLTGIALGWVQTRGDYTSEQDLVAACIECDFCVRTRWRAGLPEKRSEGLLLDRMAQEAKGRNCPHWEVFLNYFENGGLHWHEWIVDRERTHPPGFRLGTFEERMALRPKSLEGVNNKDLVDAVAMASVVVQAVK